MIRVNSTCARGASAMGVPGWPELARCTASIDSPRITSIPRCSSSRTSMSVVAIAPLRLLRIGSAPAYGSEQREAGGESVQEGLPTDRTDLARAERTGDRQRTEELVDDGGVVV